MGLYCAHMAQDVTHDTGCGAQGDDDDVIEFALVLRVQPPCACAYARYTAQLKICGSLYSMPPYSV